MSLADKKRLDSILREQMESLARIKSKQMQQLDEASQSLQAKIAKLKGQLQDISSQKSREDLEQDLRHLLIKKEEVLHLLDYANSKIADID